MNLKTVKIELRCWNDNIRMKNVPGFCVGSLPVHGDHFRDDLVDCGECRWAEKKRMRTTRIEERRATTFFPFYFIGSKLEAEKYHCIQRYGSIVILRSLELFDFEFYAVRPVLVPVERVSKNWRPRDAIEIYSFGFRSFMKHEIVQRTASSNSVGFCEWHNIAMLWMRHVSLSDSNEFIAAFWNWIFYGMRVAEHILQ